ncbi:hypothetical protein M3Y96_00442900 [Aphelenchoides besseyi]|nr:hypothetical protein M3Y96_00442900 [Aphelenchoides besseyi]
MCKIPTVEYKRYGRDVKGFRFMFMAHRHKCLPGNVVTWNKLAGEEIDMVEKCRLLPNIFHCMKKTYEQVIQDFDAHTFMRPVCDSLKQFRHQAVSDSYGFANVPVACREMSKSEDLCP